MYCKGLVSSNSQQNRLVLSISGTYFLCRTKKVSYFIFLWDSETKDNNTKLHLPSTSICRTTFFYYSFACFVLFSILYKSFRSAQISSISYSTLLSLRGDIDFICIVGLCHLQRINIKSKRRIYNSSSNNNNNLSSNHFCKWDSVYSLKGHKIFHMWARIVARIMLLRMQLLVIQWKPQCPMMQTRHVR